MKNKLYVLFICTALLFGAVSVSAQTTDTQSLQNYINSLREMVTSLQNQLNTLTPSYTTTSQGTAVTQTTTSAGLGRNLRLGDSGDDVLTLTQVLLREGFLTVSQNTFNQRVFDAVVKFQEAHATQILTPDGLDRGTGFVGTRTRNYINGLLGATVQTSAPQCSVPTTNLRIGDTGAEVSALTQALVREGLLTSAKSTFDQSVFDAVVRYQEKYAAQILAPEGIDRGTGFVGARTRSHMSSRCTGTVVVIPPTTTPTTGTGTGVAVNPMTGINADWTTVGSGASGPRKLLEQQFNWCKYWAVKSWNNKTFKTQSSSGKLPSFGSTGDTEKDQFLSYMNGDKMLLDPNANMEFYNASFFGNYVTVQPEVAPKCSYPAFIEQFRKIADGQAGNAVLPSKYRSLADVSLGVSTGGRALTQAEVEQAIRPLTLSQACNILSNEGINNLYPERSEQVLTQQGDLVAPGTSYSGFQVKKGDLASFCPSLSIQWADDHKFSMVPFFEIQPGPGQNTIPLTNIAPIIVGEVDLAKLGEAPVSAATKSKLSSAGYLPSDKEYLVWRMRSGVPVFFYALTENQLYTIEARGLPPGLTYDKTIVAPDPHVAEQIGRFIPFTPRIGNRQDLGSIYGTPSAGVYISTFKVTLKSDPSRYSVTNIVWVVGANKKLDMNITSASGAPNPTTVALGEDVRFNIPSEIANAGARNSDILTPITVTYYAVPLSTSGGSCNTSSIQSFGTCNVSEGNYPTPDFAKKIVIGKGAPATNFTWKVGTQISESNNTALPAGRYVIYYEDERFGGAYGSSFNATQQYFGQPLPGGISLRIPLGNIDSPSYTRVYQPTLYWGVSQPFTIQGGSLPGWNTTNTSFVQNTPGTIVNYDTLGVEPYIKGKNLSTGAVGTNSFASNQGEYNDLLQSQGWYGGTLKVKVGDQVNVAWMSADFKSQTYSPTNYNKLKTDIIGGNYSPYLKSGQVGPMTNIRLVEKMGTIGLMGRTESNRPACTSGFNTSDQDFNVRVSDYYKVWEGVGTSGNKTITIPECERGRTYYITFSTSGVVRQDVLGSTKTLKIEIQ